MTASGPHRVVIAGGGFAALEAMIALRRLAGGRVELVLVSSERELAYPPLSVVEPFGLGDAPRFDLAEIARDHEAELHVDAAESVDTGRRVLRTRSDGEISYDSLLVTTGAEPREAVPGALTFRGSADRPAFEGLLADLDAGRVRSVAFAVPAGTAWPLPLYELALMTAARADANDVAAHFSLVTAEEAPLGIFGNRASEAVRSLLRERGFEVHTSTAPVAFEDGWGLQRPRSGRRALVDLHAFRVCDQEELAPRGRSDLLGHVGRRRTGVCGRRDGNQGEG
jgi:sulfide:quinone oxidoreductase